MLVRSAGTREKLLDICDHKPIYVTLTYKASQSKDYKRMSWNYRQGSYGDFRSLILRAPWKLCNVHNGVNQTFSNWVATLINSAEA